MFLCKLRARGVSRGAFLEKISAKRDTKKKIWPGGEGVTRRSAKPLCGGSSPPQAFARVAELVDALDLRSSTAKYASSTLAPGTT